MTEFQTLKQTMSWVGLAPSVKTLFP